MGDSHLTTMTTKRWEGRIFHGKSDLWKYSKVKKVLFLAYFDSKSLNVTVILLQFRFFSFSFLFGPFTAESSHQVCSQSRRADAILQPPWELWCLWSLVHEQKLADGPDCTALKHRGSQTQGWPSILPADGESILVVLQEADVHSNQRGPIHSHHLAPDDTGPSAGTTAGGTVTNISRGRRGRRQKLGCACGPHTEPLCCHQWFLAEKPYKPQRLIWKSILW